MLWRLLIVLALGVASFETLEEAIIYPMSHGFIVCISMPDLSG